MIIPSLFFALNSSAAAFDSLIDLIRFFSKYHPTHPAAVESKPQGSSDTDNPLHPGLDS